MAFADSIYIYIYTYVYIYTYMTSDQEIMIKVIDMYRSGVL